MREELVDTTRFADTFKGYGLMRPKYPIFAVLHWWTLDWDWDVGVPVPGAGAKKLAWMAENPAARGTYHGVEISGTAYQTGPLNQVAWHAGGSPGIKNVNSRSIGFAVATPSPKLGPPRRGLEGQVHLDWHDRPKGVTRKAWYPPNPDRAALEAAAAFFRHAQRAFGRRFDGIYCHHHINPQKNDLRNMDEGGNAGMLFSEFLAACQI